jgi:hypothetical protein
MVHERNIAGAHRLARGRTVAYHRVPRFDARMPDDPENIALRASVIDGNGYPDDYQVVWRGRSPL